MKNKLNAPFPTLLWALLFAPISLFGQTFTDITGPLGTTRCLLKGQNDTLYLGSNTKGVYRSLDHGQSWTGVGGNTIGTGRINDLLFDLSGQLIAATEQGGIKKWNGSTWINANSGLFTACGITLPIRALAMAPNGERYAGGHGYSACFPNGDIYKDSSGIWISISNGLANTNINTLAIDPSNGNLIAGTDGGVFQWDGNAWNPLNNGLGDLDIHKLSFATSGDLFAASNDGVFKMPVNGSIWVNLSNGLNGDPVHAIAIDQDNNHLLISTGFSIEQPGSLYGRLYESTDGGNQWHQVGPHLNTTVVTDLEFAGNQICVAAGWGIFRSSDNGQNWSASNNGFSGRTFNTQGRLAITPLPNKALFYGSDEGVFRSVDEGLTWTMASNGLNRHIVTLLKSDRVGNLFCGVMRYLGENSVGFGDGMLYKSIDQGENWFPVSISKDWRYMEMSELTNGDLICAHGFGAQLPSATIVGSSLAYSNDYGDTWKDLDVKSGMAFCCAANASGDLFVAGESQSVFRSTDGGNSFELIVAPGQSGNVGTLEVSPSGEIFMSSGGQRTFYFSQDNGSSYESFSSTVLPDYRGASDVVFDDDGIAYCTTAGQGGAPALFTISPPFSSNSLFTPVSGLSGSLFKMTWDDCGYLYIYRAGGILKSNLPLRKPLPACIADIQDASIQKSGLEIFPNPCDGFLHLHTANPEPLKISLWTCDGKKLLETQCFGNSDLNLEGVMAGFYWLSVQQVDGQLEYLKLIKN